MAAPGRFRSIAVGKPWPGAVLLYRPSTGMGGRRADPDVSVVEGDGLAAARDGPPFALSADSR